MWMKRVKPIKNSVYTIEGKFPKKFVQYVSISVPLFTFV